ncbi:DUF3592 domain-containing protein [Erwinia sorbitola]|uniref:DUF3592 domain-containing protein n=1 Tax=Erwinia sorbitola TaxID=2681984 RepID=A0A6I6EHF2_9GAMM|nr:DUF3592 domain-containing protein [Erwinia sorbitola]QGU89184.1 DUF3592 domain-containing protein [Erwinia sorbitola]
MKKIFNVILAIGIILAGLSGYLFYDANKFKQEAVYTEGEVTELHFKRGEKGSSGSWAPEVTFNDSSGKQWVFRSSVSSSRYHDLLGKSIGVIYSRDNPGEAIIDDAISLYAMSAVVGFISAVFMLIGFIGVLIIFRGGNKKRLKHNGKPVQAEIVDVVLNDSIEINGRSPWRIICQWHAPQSERIYIFKSENIFYDPSPYIKNNKITVYVALNDFKKYYVDLSVLPEKA